MPPHETATRPAPLLHGRRDLPRVTVESYNLELRDADGFLGDKASETAFRALLDDWRDRLAGHGGDPLGTTPTGALERETLDEALVDPDPDAAAVVEGAVEQFSHALADVLARFLGTKGWRGVERVVCGGGLQSSLVGRRAVKRTAEILRQEGRAVGLVALAHDPDEGGMIGWVHAAPPEILARGEAILAVDIGGTNLRCGTVRLAPGGARVGDMEKWCHAEESPSRAQTVERLGRMLLEAAGRADRGGVPLSPFIGLACPGVILPDGRIDRGVQNLPGDWTDEDFHLPELVRDMVPEIGGRPTTVLMHNDAVIQGLSQFPLMGDVTRWAAVTIGTGLGNCSFSNRPA